MSAEWKAALATAGVTVLLWAVCWFGLKYPDRTVVFIAKAFLIYGLLALLVLVWRMFRWYFK